MIYTVTFVDSTHVHHVVHYKGPEICNFAQKITTNQTEDILTGDLLWSPLDMVTVYLEQELLKK